MIKGRAFVTGASGFIGSHLTRRLVHEGLDVHILLRAGSNCWRIGDVLPHVTAHVADLRDTSSLNRVVATARPDYVFHLGASPVVAGASEADDEIIASNLRGTAQLVTACNVVEYRGMVMTGDAFEYTPSHDRLSESAACQPASLHGVTKLAATLQAQAVAREQRRPIVTLRLFSTYGPADHPQRLVPQVITHALAGTDLSLSRPDVTRDWVYIDDVVELYLEAALSAERNAGCVFNVGSGNPVNIKSVVRTVLRLTESQARPRWGTFPAPPHDRYPWVADPMLTYSVFSWRPEVALEEGLARTITATEAAGAR
jgi:nucleoside-diphosphate-sugar epimerase